VPDLVALLVAGALVAGALVAGALVALRARRRRTAVVPVPATIVLPAPAGDVPPPRRRLARGSVGEPVTPLPEDVRRRAVIRPSHARR
jgi:hypothetical protein